MRMIAFSCLPLHQCCQCFTVPFCIARRHMQLKKVIKRTWMAPWTCLLYAMLIMLLCHSKIKLCCFCNFGLFYNHPNKPTTIQYDSVFKPRPACQSPRDCSSAYSSCSRCCLLMVFCNGRSPAEVAPVLLEVSLTGVGASFCFILPPGIHCRLLACVLSASALYLGRSQHREGHTKDVFRTCPCTDATATSVNFAGKEH